MVSFEFTEEQKQIQALMKDVGEKETTRKEMDELSDKVARAKTAEEVRALQPNHLYKKFHQVGLRQLAIPEKYGGGGLGFGHHITRALVSEQSGYTLGIGARLLGMEWRHCSAMCGATDEERKDWFFTKLMENDTMLTAGCNSEPESGFSMHSYEPKENPGSMGKVTAFRDGDDWIINGDKMFSSGSGVAGLFYVSGRTDKNLPLRLCEEHFWLEQGTPGVSFIPNNFCADEISGNFQTFFENVRVPEFQRIKAEWGWTMLTGASKHLFITAILGDAQYIYDWLVDYAKQRMGGGRPLIRHTHIAAMLGKLSLQIEAARAFCYRGAWELDQAQLAGKPLNVSYWCGGSYSLVKMLSWDLCEIAAEIVGGITSSLDLPIEAFLRRTYVWHGGGGGGPNSNYIHASMARNQHGIGEYGWGEEVGSVGAKGALSRSDRAALARSGRR